MTTIYITSTGQSVWDAEDRIESAAGSPLNEEGVDFVDRLVTDLTGEKIAAVYAAGAEAEIQAGKKLAQGLDVKFRRHDELREIDYGLLQGLTRGEFRKRHTKLQKLWQHSPADFRAPNGETLEEVRRRLIAALREIVRKHKNESVAVVLRPVCRAVAQCVLEDLPLEQIQPYLEEASFTWSSFETRASRFKQD